jgi:predicted GIY-YIG superfamily endonuclease
MRREYHFYVYIMQSVSRRALYIGLTNQPTQARLAAQKP